MHDFDDLVRRLEDVAAELDERSFEQLREAVADGDVARPVADRRMMQARRAIDKAVVLLRRLDDDRGADAARDP